MLKLHDFCNRAGARILWCTPVFGQAVGTQHIDEILAVWYPTHKTFLDLSDAPGAKESYRLRGACVAYAVLHRCSGSNSPLDGNGSNDSSIDMIFIMRYASPTGQTRKSPKENIDEPRRKAIWREEIH